MFFRFRLCHSKGGNGWNRAGPPFLGGMDFRGRGRINGKLYSIRCEGEFYRMGIRWQKLVVEKKRASKAARALSANLSRGYVNVSKELSLNSHFFITFYIEDIIGWKSWHGEKLKLKDWTDMIPRGEVRAWNVPSCEYCRFNGTSTNHSTDLPRGGMLLTLFRYAIILKGIKFNHIVYRFPSRSRELYVETDMRNTDTISFISER